MQDGSLEAARGYMVISDKESKREAKFPIPQLNSQSAGVTQETFLWAGRTSAIPKAIGHALFLP